MKSHLIVTTVSLLFASNLIAQNLVPNPDFELRDTDFCGIATSGDFGTSLSDWYSPSSGSPDVYYTDIDPNCWNFQPNSTYPGPIGLKGAQSPRSGNSMAGIGLYTIAGMNQREYIQVELTSPTVVSGKYLVECYISLADFTEFSSNNLSFALTTTPLSSGGNQVLAASPQFVNSTVIEETQEWVRIADTITVTEAYQYLTIGNFNDDASTTTLSNPTASLAPGTYGSYYFIDDVRVERLIEDSTATTMELSRISAVSIFPNPAADEVWVEFMNENSQGEISLFDANGKVVWSIKNAEKSQKIDLRKVEAGTYFVRVKIGEDSYFEKIIVE